MKLDPPKTAFLTLDLQKGVFGLVPDSERVMSVAAKAVAFARENQFRIIHVGLGFSEGHPEILDFESPFLLVKRNNLFVKGTPSVEFHGDIFHPDDLVIYKQRVGAFSDNHLELVLRSRRIEHLVFFGIATSGIVLSTLSRAFDLDFRSVVLKDACFDADQDVHRVLTEKVFPVQAWVAATDEFIAAQKG
ncbi:MAG: cysteine hydrolase [Candidatus Acidiferrales bacterium]|jgi:nicotinamidase-related amidase